MTKRLSKLLCAMLSVILILSILPSFALADSGSSTSDFADADKGLLSEAPTGKVHLILGDSIAAGFGLDSYWAIRNASNQPTADAAIIPDSYAGIVSDAFGSCDDAISRAHCAWRTTDFVNIVGHHTIGSTWIEQYFGRAMLQLSEEQALEEYYLIPEAIQKADYITMDFGCNDMYTVALFRLMDESPFLMGDLELPDLDISSIKSIEDLIENAQKIINLVGDTKETLDILYDAMEEGMNQVIENYPELLNIVTENIQNGPKPETQVYVMGLDNVLKITLSLSDKLSYDLYTKCATYVTRINLFLRDLCRKYPNVTFVDVSGAPYFGISYLLSNMNDIGNAGHPTSDGHKYIANKLIAAIGPRFEKPVISVSENKLHQASLKWDKLDGAYSYRVYRSDNAYSGFKLIGSTVLNHYTDPLSTGGSYYYRIIAVTGLNSRSGASAPVQFISSGHDPLLIIKTPVLLCKLNFGSLFR